MVWPLQVSVFLWHRPPLPETNSCNRGRCSVQILGDLCVVHWHKQLISARSNKGQMPLWGPQGNHTAKIKRHKNKTINKAANRSQKCFKFILSVFPKARSITSACLMLPLTDKWWESAKCYFGWSPLHHKTEVQFRTRYPLSHVGTN